MSLPIREQPGEERVSLISHTSFCCCFGVSFVGAVFRVIPVWFLTCAVD